MTLKSENSCGNNENCCGGDSVGRRGFIKATGLTAAMLLADQAQVMAGPFEPQATDHGIPADKKLSKQWIASLYERGEPLSATTGQLNYIGMPISGICTGQVYLGGDGRLWHWNLDATKRKANTPKGPSYKKPEKQNSPLGVGFALQVGNKTRPLDGSGFKNIKFTNEYPMGLVDYRDKACPVDVQLQAYTPFIPLNRDDSSYPVIVMRYTISNSSAKPQDVAIAGWVENISKSKGPATKICTYSESENITTVECSSKSTGGNKRKGGPDNYTMALGILGPDKPEIVDLAKTTPTAKGVFDDHEAVNDGDQGKLDGERAFGSLGRKLTLAAGESKTIVFAVSWCLPAINYGIGFGKATKRGQNHYATIWPTASKASIDLAKRETELFETTRKWVDTWYDSTLPYWFLERTFVTINCIQTQMGQRILLKDGETDIYNFEEGVRCCPGNCTHVWHYAHGLSRIFPVIERESRDKVEYGLGFDKETGGIAFRYMGGKFGDAIDGNCGTILRVLRESQMTTDYTFLESIWERVQLSMDHVIKKWDPDKDGMLVGAQHNTLDEPWHGQVHWLTNLYHAALKASAVMARQMKQPEIADRYEAIVAKGMPAMVELLWNQEFGYFIHKPGDSDKEKHGSTNGCHIDQVLGDSWLHNVGIAPILPQDKIRAALQALWKFNFAPDVGAFRKVQTNGRWYAVAGDAGLVMCSFPNGKILPKSGKANYAGYLNECMTGFEWQVAAHMIWQGMLEEGLAIGKAIYDRYQPKSRNPYNEIECSDHYSRAMASYGAFQAACGYQYDGPEGKLAFGPRMQPEDFRAAFTTAAGWGQFSQNVKDGRQQNAIELRYGKLRLKQLTLDLAPNAKMQNVTVKLDDADIETKIETAATKTTITFVNDLNINAGQTIKIQSA